MSNTTIGLEAARQVGEILQRKREGRNLTLDEVAEQTGISERRLRQIEKGETPRGGRVIPTRLPRAKLMDLCDVLGIEMATANRILSLAGYQPLDDVREVVYLHDLPEDAQRRIRALAAKYRGRAH
ncbi:MULTISPECIES: RodZ family helix-turn-helix domain-containing protein [unclassified Nocardia]|uniref:helix-turn-helix domain-containing protein n=1 Tax=unclassified Nocardia TaxID=2637762 RepID=UPI00278C1E34|nr:MULTISPECIES: helix-turn-helix domain-containing protein [unclassified Nocardia]